MCGHSTARRATVALSCLDVRTAYATIMRHMALDFSHGSGTKQEYFARLAKFGCTAEECEQNMMTQLPGAPGSATVVLPIYPKSFVTCISKHGSLPKAPQADLKPV